jgi:hypothetical protein
MRSRRLSGLPLGVFALVLGALILVPGANARGQTTTTWIPGTGYATAIDSPPTDGVFDEFINPGYASIGNNGYSEIRGRVGFPMGEVPGAATIASASVNLVLGNFDGTRSLAVHGQSGNCSAELPDFAAGVLLATLLIEPVGTITAVVDVTPLVADARASGAACVEILLRETPANDANYTLMGADAATLVVEVSGDSTRAIDIDVKPGTMPNSINRASRGLVTVAVLSSTEFDAASLDPASLTFGRSGDEPSLARCNPLPEDMNGDGLADVVCHFATQAAGFLSTDTEGVLKGRTVDGWQVRGSDSVRIVK